jgi:hypothetical protein
VTLPDGSRRRRIVRRHDGEPLGAFRKRASAQVTALVAEAEAGLVVASTTTVGDYAARWLATERDALARGRSQRRPSTVSHHEFILRQYVVPLLGSRRLSSLTRRHIEEMLDALADRELRQFTVRRARISLSVLLRAARRDGLVATIATEDAVIPTVSTPRREVPFRSASELARLLDELAGERRPMASLWGLGD